MRCPNPQNHGFRVLATRASKTTSAGRSSQAAEPKSSRSDAPKPKEASHRWTFLTNHAHVLVVLHADPEMVLREVAARVRITERAVQRIVQDLEEEGFIRREKVGRQNRYEVLVDKSLRHPIESHRQIGELLDLIGKNHADENRKSDV
ncbi:helix-turn-helix transcriptional regulator [Rubripirellula tenax]|nr:MarR family transcriptional regulator [Rubripirellula tenax]